MDKKLITPVFYSIGQVARMFDVTESSIRYWEQEFDMINPRRNKKGDRQFTPADVDKFHLIYHLVKEKGMTLQGAKKQLKVNLEETERLFEVIKRLKSVKEQLLAIKKELSDEEGKK